MIKESKVHKQILKLDPLVIAQEFTRIVRLLYTEFIIYIQMTVFLYLSDAWRVLLPLGLDGVH